MNALRAMWLRFLLRAIELDIAMIREQQIRMRKDIEWLDNRRRDLSFRLMRLENDQP